MFPYKIQENELVRLSWNQFGQLCDLLYERLDDYLKKNNFKIDLIVPILREGGFTGLTLAYKINTYKILPIQYKYLLYNGGSELKQISSFPEIFFEIPDAPGILICDTFPAGGKTKKLVIQTLKQKFPRCKIIFASLIGDNSASTNPDILINIFAIGIDEKGYSSDPLAKEMGITNTMNILFPWENAEEEIASVAEKEFKYN